MSQSKNILFTQDENYYSTQDSSFKSNYFIASDLSGGLGYVLEYKPQFVMFDYSFDRTSVVNCILEIKKITYYSPSIMITERKQMLDILKGDMRIQIDRNTFVEIPTELDYILDDMLQKLRFSVNLKGYEYIKRCVFEGIYNPLVFESMKKNLYEQVAKTYKSSKYSVERGISFSIKKAYLESKSNKELVNYFASGGNIHTNSTFLKKLLMEVKHKRNAKNQDRVNVDSLQSSFI